MKAMKLYTTYGNHSNIVTYEYRGKQYDVEYAKDWSYCVTSPKIQHQDAQSRIDNEIDHPVTATSHAQVGLDLFFSQYE